MKKNYIVLTCLLTIITFNVFSQNAELEVAIDNYHRYYTDGQKIKNSEKEKSISDYRQYYSKHEYHNSSLNDEKLSATECISLLNEEGQFSDLKSLEQKMLDEKMLEATSESAR